MIVGIDYWNTISQSPDLFRELSKSLLASGHEVHIVTAVGRKRKDSVLHDIEQFNIPCTVVKVLIFSHPGLAPDLKLQYCKENNIQLFIDDRKDTCEALNRNGITALNIIKKR